MEENATPPAAQADTKPGVAADPHEYLCDRCGSQMIERNCKVVCSNCGNLFDCSDLSLYFD